MGRTVVGELEGTKVGSVEGLEDVIFVGTGLGGMLGLLDGSIEGTGEG